MAIYERKRFLIWGKTSPELSTKYFETVCTGAVLEDGSPIRLYPIPFRYLQAEEKFKKYQWMTALIGKDPCDSRPESYKIDCDSIEPGHVIEPDELEWHARREFVFQKPSWQFESVDALAQAQLQTKQSLGVVIPSEIVSVGLHARPEDEEASFEQKRERCRKKFDADRQRLFDDFFPAEYKNLDFVRNRIQIVWKCGSGKTHTSQFMDWEIVEAQRKHGDENARQMVEDRLDLSKFAVRFFLGNIRAYPSSFTIVGLWYPKRQPGLLF
jgi:hypothetical protein